jgi:protein MPE1
MFVAYDDDTTQIPRSTTVIVKRTPAQKPGAGRAARYITGQMPLHAKNSHRTESHGRGAAHKHNAASSGGPIDTSGMTEEEKLAAVMNASNTQLKADLEMSANSGTVKRNTFKSAAVPDKPLPPGYVCYRCRKKGHWIQACPTNNDPTFDGKKPKRTTGIPRSMLEKVEEPDSTKELPQGVFMNQDGDYVRVKTDEATWQKIQDQQKAAAEKAKQAAQGDEELRTRGLECPLDKRAFVVPVKTPCCNTTYCYDCIETALCDNDLLCPTCGEQCLIDALEPDDETTKKLAEYEDEKKAAQRQKDKETSKTPPAAMDAKSPAGSATTPDAKANGTDSRSSSSPSNSPSKKRAAEEELENKRRPSNPADMKKALSTNGTAIPTGPKAATAPQAVAPKAPKNMTDFVNQMNSMSGGQPGMNVPFNPMMGGMGPMNMGMPMNGMGMSMGMGMGMGMMPNYNMMNMGMNGMGMGMGMGMGVNGMGGGFNGLNGMNGGGMAWQNQNPNQAQNQQPWMNGNRNANGIPTGPAADNGGAYFRQPVNPHRHQNKQRRQRSVDYKQM